MPPLDATRESHPVIPKVRSAKRRATGSLVVLGYTTLFVASFVSAFVLHLDLAATRRLLKDTVTSLLDQELLGTVDIGQIERLDSDAIWLRNVTVYDDQRRPVIRVEKLHARARTFQALWDVIAAKDKLTLIVDSAWGDGASVSLLPTNEPQIPSLVRAFEPDPARKRSSSRTTSRPFRIFLPEIELAHLDVENRLPSVPFTSARLRRTAGLVLVTQDGAAVSIKRFGIAAKGLVEPEIGGVGNLEFRSPGRLWGQLNVSVGAVAVTGRVDFRNDELSIEADVPKVTPEQARSVIPSWPLQRPATLSLVTHGPVTALATRVNARVD
ncbi:MAG: hypothetical protein QM784_01775 [Polyangiaceae bacterium]